MPTFTEVDDGEIDQDSPITVGLETKGRDNPIAMSLRDPTALAAGVLHPADWTKVEDIFDYSIDGNTNVATTSTFEDGYEYALVGDNISLTTGGSLLMALYRGDDTAWSGDVVIASSLLATDYEYFFIQLNFSRAVTESKYINIKHYIEVGAAMASNAQATLTDVSTVSRFGTAQPVGKALVKTNVSSTYMDSGTITLYRRSV